MSNTNKPEITTDIDKIDSILDQLDKLLKQLPEDYQMDYAHEILGRFED